MNCNKRIAKFIQKLKDKITPPSKDKYELVTLVNDGLTPDEFYEWAKRHPQAFQDWKTAYPSAFSCWKTRFLESEIFQKSPPVDKNSPIEQR